MSRIFEALQKSEDPVAELVLPLIGAGEGAQAAAESFTAAWPPVAPESRIRAFPIHAAPNSGLLPFDGSDSRAAEQYRIIRTKILQDVRQARVLVISSPELGDGKSLSAANIAGVLALKQDARVLLVDVDFRRASLRRLFGLTPGAPGLAEVLAGTVDPLDAILRIESLPNLHLLPCGARPANPVELLDSRAWPALCENLRRQFAYIVLDAPPIGLVADYDLIQAVAAGVLVVIRPDHTRRPLCYQALAAIPQEKLLGIVLNCVPDWFLGRAFGYHQYDYYSDKS